MRGGSLEGGYDGTTGRVYTDGGPHFKYQI